MALPDFLCIGAQKAGTSWLRVMLHSNPAVWMGMFKELHYFDSLYTDASRRWTSETIRSNVRFLVRRHVVRAVKQGEKVDTGRKAGQVANIDLDYLARVIKLADENYMFTEDWYRAMFDFPAGAKKIKGEITPEYSTISAEGIQYVHKLLGPVPIIYLIRDPVGRALSHVRMKIARRKDRTEFSEDEWNAMIRREDVFVNGDYKGNVTRWMENYPNEKLLFLPYRDVSTEPNELLAKVEKFVGIPPHKYEEAEKEVYKGAVIDIPPYVIERMRELLAEQYVFLEATFGAEFCKRI